MKLKVTGLRDLERALAELPAGTAKGVVRRVLKKELAPTAQIADSFWPGGGGGAYKISSRITRSQRSDSTARRGRSVVNMFVGSTHPLAHLIEFGTAPRQHKSGKSTGMASPLPMLQPAWDMRKADMLDRIGKQMWIEIEKTVARRAKRAAKAG